MMDETRSRNGPSDLETTVRQKKRRASKLSGGNLKGNDGHFRHLPASVYSAETAGMSTLVDHIYPITGN
jgi:hypothetical protein